MESQESTFRLAMIRMRSRLQRFVPPKLCITCYGWEHFGGLDAKNVTMGPMCVCDKNWYRVQAFIKNEKKVLSV